MRREDEAEMLLQQKQGHSNEQMAGDRNKQCEIEAHLFNTGCDWPWEKNQTGTGLYYLPFSSDSIYSDSN